jgi:thiol-disulfide isomerase/thioredoxin
MYPLNKFFPLMRLKEAINSSIPKILKFLVLVLLCLKTGKMYGQTDQVILLTVGDTAPPLFIKDWIKGPPIKSFEKGKVYVIEFWATWCKPCKAAIPHLSALADKYKDKVAILGIDVLENKATPIQKIKSFVDSMGNQMNYSVATEEGNFMETAWLNASQDGLGIPKTFVVNADGKLAWIGHPKNLSEILPQIVYETWNIKDALNKRNSDRYLRELDDSLNNELMKYRENDFKKDYIGKPKSALSAIKEIVRKEPRLKYAPLIAYNTFTSLLKTNQHEAYEYGKVLMQTSTYEEPPYFIIYDAIHFFSNRLKLSKEIYDLGVQAHQMDIDKFPYPELLNFPKRYSKMAELYWRAGNKLKAIESQQKAIESLRDTNDFSKTELEKLKSQLQKYKNM